MPKLRKTHVQRRPAAPPAREARESDSERAPLTVGRITDAELNAEVPAETGAVEVEAEPVSEPGAETSDAGGRPDLAGEAQSSFEGGDQAEPAPDMTPEQIVGLVEMGKGMMVELLGATLKVDRALIDDLAPIPPMTRALLLRFAPDFARYMPALNANAPLVGACAFAALAALDMYGASKKLRAAAKKKEPAPSDARAQSPGSAPRWSGIVGADEIRAATPDPHART